jgi:transcriptional regulator
MSRRHRVLPSQQPAPPVFGAGGLTHKQIGEKLGITRARVHQIEHRALKKLRAALTIAALNCGLTLREYLFGDLEGSK